MTLLSIANAVADETKGPRTETIAGNTDPAAQNILRLINRVGFRLMLNYPWQILRAEKAFTGSGNETLLAAADMPADFNRFVPETFWDRDTEHLLSGPVSPVEWNGLKVQTNSEENKKFIRRGGAILTQPVFAIGANLAFEYVRNGWVDTAAGGANKTAMTIDTDVSEIEEELIIAASAFAWLDAEGQPSGMAFQHLQDMFNLVTKADDGSMPILVTADIFSRNSRHHDGTPQAFGTGGIF